MTPLEATAGLKTTPFLTALSTMMRSFFGEEWSLAVEYYPEAAKEA